VTSTGQNDSGLFEANLRDERYLPFENSGVISEWQIDLPKQFREFDYGTIADLILHFRFTARQGGEPLRRAAEENLVKKIAEARAAGTVRLFSLRHEFPTEWAQFKSRKAYIRSALLGAAPAGCRGALPVLDPRPGRQGRQRRPFRSSQPGRGEFGGRSDGETRGS
jgi:hypothetical protein